jgi:hypothetical protein
MFPFASREVSLLLLLESSESKAMDLGGAALLLYVEASKSRGVPNQCKFGSMVLVADSYQYDKARCYSTALFYS